MKRALLCLPILFILFLGQARNARAESPKPVGEEAAVRAVVESYLHGLKFNDVTGFQKAFWPDAKLYFVRKSGELGQLTQQDWYKGFAANAGKEEPGTLRIAAVDVTGTVASAKIQEDYAEGRYVDYLSLVKFGGHWKIVNKVYDFMPAKKAER